MSESNVKFTRDEALDFHSRGRPGKIEIVASKPMATQRDLSLAYSPGVAVPVEAIAANPVCASILRQTFSGGWPGAAWASTNDSTLRSLGAKSTAWLNRV